MFSRRRFLKLLGVSGVAAAVFPLAARAAGPTCEVIVLRPINGRKYPKALKGHFANKIYPNERCAFDRLPYRWVKCIVTDVQVTLPQDVTRFQMFGGRNDLDVRVAGDRKHLESLGFDMNMLEAEISL
ncbi:MAG: twin-arginine translocation signal domain-containing protein [Verrucomicrobia bacterium]|nr:twin-arginine translocation signal domain-containing protein [Verrucomicrobiota bacterium]